MAKINEIYKEVAKTKVKGKEMKSMPIDEFYDEITERFGEEMAKKISERVRKA